MRDFYSNTKLNTFYKRPSRPMKKV